MAHIANNAAAGAVATIIKIDSDTGTAVDDVTSIQGLSDDATGISVIRFGDASCHMQVLDGSALDDAERSTIVVAAVVGVVDGNRMSVAVEDTTERIIQVFTHLGGRRAGEGFLHRKVSHQLEIHIHVLSYSVVHLVGQQIPLFEAMDLVGFVFRPIAFEGIVKSNEVENDIVIAFVQPKVDATPVAEEGGIVGRIMGVLMFPCRSLASCVLHFEPYYFVASGINHTVFLDALHMVAFVNVSHNATDVIFNSLADQFHVDIGAASDAACPLALGGAKGGR